MYLTRQELELCNHHTSSDALSTAPKQFFHCPPTHQHQSSIIVLVTQRDGTTKRHLQTSDLMKLSKFSTVNFLLYCLYCTTSQQKHITTSLHHYITTSHHYITSLHHHITTPHYITSHYITSHYITSHYITSLHYTTLHSRGLVTTLSQSCWITQPWSIHHNPDNLTPSLPHSLTHSLTSGLQDKKE